MSRFNSVPFDEIHQSVSNEVKRRAQSLEEIIMGGPPGRSQAVAITKLEECVLWANKMIRDDQIAANKLEAQTKEQDSNVSPIIKGES